MGSRRVMRPAGGMPLLPLLFSRGCSSRDSSPGRLPTIGRPLSSRGGGGSSSPVPFTYPRSVPEMWPDLIQKTKGGGLDVIQTYVFWNGHEPSAGNYYFGRRYDLVRSIKLAKQAGLYVHLRIGDHTFVPSGISGKRVQVTVVLSSELSPTSSPLTAGLPPSPVPPPARPSSPPLYPGGASRSIDFATAVF